MIFLQLNDAKLQRLKIQPSAPVDDAGFLRRASLDLTGQLPEPNEVRAFVSDPTPSKVKRSKLIDISLRCPVHLTLERGSHVDTITLPVGAAADAQPSTGPCHARDTITACSD